MDGPNDVLADTFGPISPELVLVTPELRHLALAALPPFELDRRPAVAIRPLAAPAQAPRASLARDLRAIAVFGLVMFLACTVLVLTLTEVADAIR